MFSNILVPGETIRNGIRISVGAIAIAPLVLVLIGLIMMI